MTWITDYCRNTTKSSHKFKISAHSTINKLAMDWETLRNGVHDLQKANSFTTGALSWRLQLQGEGYRKFLSWWVFKKMVRIGWQGINKILVRL
jgi:hypothetical protein